MNLPMVVPAILPEQPTEEESQALAAIELYVSNKAGYANLMNTRPQTIGYALSDSPVALAVWMYEKFQEWTDNRGQPEDALSREKCWMTSPCTGLPAPACPARGFTGKAWAAQSAARTFSLPRVLA